MLRHSMMSVHKTLLLRQRSRGSPLVGLGKSVRLLNSHVEQGLNSRDERLGVSEHAAYCSSYQ